MNVICSIEGCGRPELARGWCNTHYSRWKQHGDPLPDVPVERRGPRTKHVLCTVPGCDRPHRVRGWCMTHYNRWKKHGDALADQPVGLRERAICTIEGCERHVKGRSLCDAHYARVQRTGQTGPSEIRPLEPQPATCAVESCDLPAKSRGWCRHHYYKWSQYGDPNHVTKRKTEWITSEGYRLMRAPAGHPNAKRNGMILEHRLVISEHIGRPLRAGETVHHRNGNRLDNRIENLELWASSHPSGQRVSDLDSDTETVAGYPLSRSLHRPDDPF